MTNINTLRLGTRLVLTWLAMRPPHWLTVFSCISIYSLYVSEVKYHLAFIRKVFVNSCIVRSKIHPIPSIHPSLRCRLNFALLWSAVLCIRGRRLSKRNPVKSDSLDLVSHEARPWLTGFTFYSYSCLSLHSLENEHQLK